MPHLTLANVSAALRALGLTIRKNDGEYRVNYKGGSEATAYYTNDLNDALQTGLLMGQGKRPLRKNPSKVIRTGFKRNRPRSRHIPDASGFDVHVWEERDRLQIEVRNRRTDKTLVMWSDDDARQMFEDGFFKGGRALKDSVLQYCREVGLLK